MIVKKSNRVLLMVLALMVAIPMVVAMILRHKVRTGQFEIEQLARSEDPKLRISKDFNGNEIKAIKLIGPKNVQSMASVLNISLICQPENSYTIIKQAIYDSISVDRRGDTLVFTYERGRPAADGNPNQYDNLALHLFMEKSLPIVAENCSVAIEPRQSSLSGSNHTVPAPMSVYLTKGAVLEMGHIVQSPAQQPGTDTAEGQSVIVSGTVPRAKDLSNRVFTPMPAYQVFADSATVKFMQAIEFKSLQLRLQGGSTLELKQPFKTGELSGKLDRDTKIMGDLNSLSSLRGLLNQ